MDWLLNGIHDLFSVLVTDIEYLVSPHWWRTHAVPLFNILMIDLTLAGDNAIVVGMAASRVEKSMRAKVIFFGIFGAVILRIIFSSVAQQMLQVIGLTFAGGILLLFVCWKMYKQIVEAETHSIEEVEKKPRFFCPSPERDDVSGGRSGPSSSPTCRCRSTTSSQSRARQVNRRWCWSSALASQSS